MAIFLDQPYPFILPDLPYSMDALEPHVSKHTLELHHGKHHKTYVTNANNLVKDTDLAKMSLEELIKHAYDKPELKKVFNNAAQIWNHTFLWNCMSAKYKPLKSGNLLDQINKDFGSYDKFIEEFKTSAINQFGSGWAWLAWDKKAQKLLVYSTSNADLPLTKDQVAILTVDVWEHAYYVDYENLRLDYVKAFAHDLINWDFAESNFEGCK